jgi:hypothetical protein
MLEESAGNRRLRVLLDGLAPKAWEKDGLVLSVPGTLAAAAQALSGEISRCASACAKRSITVILDAPQAMTAAAPQDGRRAGDHPLVKLAEELLGAKVLRVQARVAKEQS